MAVETKCQTPGTYFNTHISGAMIKIEVITPVLLNQTKEEAELLEANIHNALELVLAPYFRGK